MILDCIVWPTSITIIFEKYRVEEEEDESDIEDISRVSGYLKRFIENGMYGCCYRLILHIRPFMKNLCCLISLFFLHSITCWAKEPRKVLDRMGDTNFGVEGGHNRSQIPDSFHVFWEAEAAKALQRLHDISWGFVCMHINQLHWFWLCVKCVFILWMQIFNVWSLLMYKLYLMIYNDNDNDI